MVGATTTYPLAPGWPQNLGESFPKFQMASVLCPSLPVERQEVRGASGPLLPSQFSFLCSSSGFLALPTHPWCGLT